MDSSESFMMEEWAIFWNTARVDGMEYTRWGRKSSLTKSTWNMLSSKSSMTCCARSCGGPTAGADVRAGRIAVARQRPRGRRPAIRRIRRMTRTFATFCAPSLWSRMNTISAPRLTITKGMA